MNDTLQEYARETLKEGLDRLPENNITLFKRMYSPDDLEADINDVVDRMSEDRLDWAMQQVQRSLEIQNKA